MRGVQVNRFYVHAGKSKSSFCTAEVFLCNSEKILLFVQRKGAIESVC